MVLARIGDGFGDVRGETPSLSNEELGDGIVI